MLKLDLFNKSMVCLKTKQKGGGHCSEVRDVRDKTTKCNTWTWWIRI